MSMHPVLLQTLLEHLASAETRTAVRLVEDPVVDGFAMVRTPASPPAEVAVLHDGTARGRAQAASMALLVEHALATLGLLARTIRHGRDDGLQAPGGGMPAAPGRVGSGLPMPPPLADTILEPIASDQGWNETSQLSILLSFLNGLFLRCPATADGLRQHLALTAASENAGCEDEDGEEAPEAVALRRLSGRAGQPLP